MKNLDRLQCPDRKVAADVSYRSLDQYFHVTEEGGMMDSSANPGNGNSSVCQRRSGNPEIDQ